MLVLCLCFAWDWVGSWSCQAPVLQISFPFRTLYYIYLFVMCVSEGTWIPCVEVRGQLSGVGMGLGDWTQVIRLCGRRLSLLSHLSGSHFLLNPVQIGWSQTRVRCSLLIGTLVLTTKPLLPLLSTQQQRTQDAKHTVLLVIHMALIRF